MTIFHTILAIAQVIAAVAVIVLVLLQHGKGADMGAAFGSGSSGSLFGATGSANFLSRATAVCATIFLLCTLGLTFYSRAENRAENKGVIEKAPVSKVEGTAPPAADVPKNSVPAAPDIPK
ncbi:MULTISPECIES: preprotein translocase subunit SecG [Limnobacter]|uniref:Protein-export membrane protein SecG n=1 Tax=Limnobacter litoralis TaxID=481366 RepID=A0ABQ5YQD3_9BURK|nr:MULTISPECIES: preprotein translocase subunit SecG [Limnobacter]GLR26823.1 preprotein translocase subunit SecG [Limnobacter litoralis]